MNTFKTLTGLFGFLTSAAVSLATETRVTIIYDDVATPVTSVDETARQLWITPADLQRATHFEIKPQGVCRGALCFPLPKARRQDFLRDRIGKTWFNLAAFANLVHQPVARDAALSTWYFGLREDQRQTFASLDAPDFTLLDLAGKPHSLSDFRGKKVLLITWASW